MKKIIATAVVIVVTLSLSPAAYAKSEDLNGVTSQEIEAAISTLPTEKLLSSKSTTYALDQASRKLDASFDVSGHSVSIGNLEINLPNPDEISEISTPIDGLTTYSSSGSSASAVLTENGRAQILTTISNRSADTLYTYELNISETQRVSLLADGSAQVINADGSIELAIGSPWAYDAYGPPVKTYYLVSGNSLIQVVEHTAENITYPVVADPIFLAPWVVRCLVGIGLNSTQITNIASRGTNASIIAAGGYAALRCVMGR